MKTAWIAQAGVVLAAVALTGCAGGGGTRAVTLVVTSAEVPVARAHVRAIPINTSPVPLPVNSKTLPELKGIKADSAFTDEAGRVTLTLADGRTFRVEVGAPMLGAGSELGPWHGVLDKADGSLVPLDAPEAGATMHVELAR